MGYAVYEDVSNFVPSVPDDSQNRWAGYAVPGVCDFKGCTEEIDRGLNYKCEVHGHYEEDENDHEEWVEEEGCGYYFCETHENQSETHTDENLDPKGDTMTWLSWIIHHSSWADWREQNPGTLAAYVRAVEASGSSSVVLFMDQGGEDG